MEDSVLTMDAKALMLVLVIKLYFCYCKYCTSVSHRYMGYNFWNYVYYNFEHISKYIIGFLLSEKGMINEDKEGWHEPCNLWALGFLLCRQRERETGKDADEQDVISQDVDVPALSTEGPRGSDNLTSSEHTWHPNFGF